MQTGVTSGFCEKPSYHVAFNIHFQKTENTSKFKFITRGSSNIPDLDPHIERSLHQHNI